MPLSQQKEFPAQEGRQKAGRVGQSLAGGRGSQKKCRTGMPPPSREQVLQPHRWQPPPPPLSGRSIETEKARGGTAQENRGLTEYKKGRRQLLTAGRHQCTAGIWYTQAEEPPTASKLACTECVIRKNSRVTNSRDEMQQQKGLPGETCLYVSPPRMFVAGRRKKENGRGRSQAGTEALRMVQKNRYSS